MAFKIWSFPRSYNPMLGNISYKEFKAFMEKIKKHQLEYFTLGSAFYIEFKIDKLCPNDIQLRKVLYSLNGGRAIDFIKSNFNLI
jgi:hypothetical protein